MATMQVSLWQAFSSNHSAYFTVVGVFKTPAEAAAAAERVQTLVNDIIEWRRSQGRSYEVNEPPTPPEVAIAQELGIDWGEASLDWVELDEAGEPSVSTLDRLVFINGPQSGWGAHPADYLLQKLGGVTAINGDVGVEGFESGTLAQTILQLTCLAVDEAAAAEIAAAVRRHLASGLPPGETEPREGLYLAGINTPWRTFGRAGHLSSFFGELVQEGRRLTFMNGRFEGLADGLSALWAYLRAWGCTEIEYSVREEREGDEAEEG